MYSIVRSNDLDLARNGDTEARARLVQSNMGLISSLSNRFGRSLGDDARSIAVLGFNHAIDHFDPSRGISFSGYSAGVIILALREEERKERLAINLRSRKTEDDYRDWLAAENLATAELGRRPNFNEIANVAGFNQDAAVRVLSKALLPYSLDLPVKSEGDDTQMPLDFLKDPSIKDPDIRIEHEQFLLQARRAFTLLPERERYIIESLYSEPRIPNSEIAETLGVGLSRVQQIRVRALEMLGKALDDDIVVSYCPSDWAQTLGVGGELSIRRFRSILWMVDLIGVPEVDRIEMGMKRCAEALGLSEESLKSLVSGEENLPPDLVFKLVRNLFKNYNPDLDQAIKMLKLFADPRCHNWRSLSPSIKRRKALSDFRTAHEAYKLDSTKVAKIMGIFPKRHERIIFGLDHLEKFELSRLDRLAWHVGQERFDGSEVFLRPESVRPSSFSRP